MFKKWAIYVHCHSGCDKSIKNHIDEVEIKKVDYHTSLGSSERKIPLSKKIPKKGREPFFSVSSLEL